MKIVYLKYKDPMIWHNPQARFYEEDLKSMSSVTCRIAGILIKEDDEKIILGEATIEEDNIKLLEGGIEFPYYRDIAIITKTSIVERKDFKIKESRKS